MDRSETTKVLLKLMLNNEDSRKSLDEGSKQYFHKECQKGVNQLKGSETGVVSTNFGYLSEVGEGKPGDTVCLLTYRYARALQKEQEDKSNVFAILGAEKIEKEIEAFVQNKRYVEKFLRL